MTWWQTVLCVVGAFVVACWAGFFALVAADYVLRRRRQSRRVVELAERFTRDAARG